MPVDERDFLLAVKDYIERAETRLAKLNPDAETAVNLLGAGVMPDVYHEIQMRLSKLESSAGS